MLLYAINGARSVLSTVHMESVGVVEIYIESVKGNDKKRVFSKNDHTNSIFTDINI